MVVKNRDIISHYFIGLVGVLSYVFVYLWWVLVILFCITLKYRWIILVFIVLFIGEPDFVNLIMDFISVRI